MRKKYGFLVRMLAVLLVSVMMLQPASAFADSPETAEQPAVETSAAETEPEETEPEDTQQEDTTAEETEPEQPEEKETGAGENAETPAETESAEEPEETQEKILLPAETQAPVREKEEKKDAAAAEPVKADEVPAGDNGDTLAVPKLIAAENTAAGIKITWEEVPGAEKYNIYRKKEGGSWSSDFSVSEKTEYTDGDDLQTGTSYTYTVRAVKGDQTSDYDKTGVTAAAVPPQPVLKETGSVSPTSLKITWEESKDTDYYYVFRKKADGTWEQISKKVTDTSFVDTSAPTAKKTVYTVRSVKKVNDTEFMSVDEEEITGKTLTKRQAEAAFASPRLRKAKGINPTTVKIAWKAAPEAEGYYIYRKNASGYWRQIAEVKGAAKLTYSDTKCRVGTKYTYTVRAFRKYGDEIIRSSDYDDDGITGTPKLTAPVLRKAEPVDNRSGIRVTWKAITGVKTYQVYRKTEGAKRWKLLKTVEKAVEYTDKTTKANTVYYYTVRAAVQTDGKTTLSPYDKNGVKSSTKVTSKVVDGLVLYYDDAGRLIKDTESIIGKQSSYKLEIDYDRNIVTVYAKGSSGNYNVPVKAFVCSTGKATPIGTFSTPAKYRWRTLMGPCYGQWCTRIHGGVLFHSVPYYTQSNNNLKVYAYNKLGTKCSAGCVRLCCRDAKWIYDNCKLGTKVTIKHNARNPFGKPSPLKLKSGHTWDPTDPNMAYKCRDRGCH